MKVEKKKKLGQVSHFGPKNYVSLWLLIRSKEFLKILHSERGRDESYMNGFSKKIHLELLGHFDKENCVSSQLWGSAVRIFLHNERRQGVHESYVNGFPKTTYPQ